jgi:hypothetical protein
MSWPMSGSASRSRTRLGSPPAGAGTPVESGARSTTLATAAKTPGTRTSSAGPTAACSRAGTSARGAAPPRSTSLRAAPGSSPSPRTSPPRASPGSARTSPSAKTAWTTSPGSTKRAVSPSPSMYAPVARGPGARWTSPARAWAAFILTPTSPSTTPGCGSLVWGWDAGSRRGDGVQRQLGERAGASPKKIADINWGKPGLASVSVDPQGAFHVVWNQGVRGDNKVYYAKLVVP